MTQLTDSERTTYEDGAWYWVEKEGWIGDPPTIAPALYKAQSDAWYSFAFSGIPTREVKVLEPCRRAPAVPTRKQIEQYLYEQGAVTVSRDVAEAAGLARLAGKMQSAPVAPVPQGLREAAQAVVERWDTPLWKDVPATAVYIADLRAALSAAPQPPEAAPVQLPGPVAFALEWTFDGEERGIRLYDDERHCRFDAESDGGVCSPLYTEQQVRRLLNAAEAGNGK